MTDAEMYVLMDLWGRAVAENREPSIEEREAFDTYRKELNRRSTERSQEPKSTSRKGE